MANTPNQPLSARCARTVGIVRGDATFRNGCPRLTAVLLYHDDADRRRCCSSVPQPRNADCHPDCIRSGIGSELIPARIEIRASQFHLLHGGVGIRNRADVGRWPSRVRPWTGNVSSDPGRHCLLSPDCRDIRLLFLLLVTLVPDAFNKSIVLTDSFGATRLLYFSFATITTTGYGDIAPVHPLARSLANLEAVIGQLFPATLLARIVTLEISAERRH